MDGIAGKYQGAFPEALAALAKEFSAIEEQARRVWFSLDKNQRIEPRPQRSGWSVAMCLVHLTMVSAAYQPIWQEALLRARSAGCLGRPPFRLDLWGRFLVWFLEPPPKIRFRTPGRFTPAHVDAGDSALEKFLVSQRELLDAVTIADGLAVDQIKIRSGFDRRIKYSVWSSFRTNLAHQRRHLRQIERIADEIRSPGNCSQLRDFPD